MKELDNRLNEESAGGEAALPLSSSLELPAAFVEAFKYASRARHDALVKEGIEIIVRLTRA